VLEEIGAGSFGCVYRARRKETREIVALKALNKKMLVRNRQLKYAVGECRILRQLQSPFVVRMFDAFQTPNSLYMVLEYCAGKDLSVLLEQKQQFSADETRFYMSEIILALEYLHERDIMYRDLKPENVLLDDFGHVKLADFGLAKENVTTSRQAKSFCGSPAYLSPETLDKQGAGKPADLYGLGAVMYEMLTGMPPYYDDDLKVLYANIRRGVLDFPRNVNNTARELIKALLSKSPALRPKLADVKAHAFFRKVNWEQLAKKQVSPPVRPRAASSPAKTAKVRLHDRDYSTEMSLEECLLDFDH
jgi:serum/glucocorticoid-regulated kinase 2